MLSLKLPAFGYKLFYINYSVDCEFVKCVQKTKQQKEKKIPQSMTVVVYTYNTSETHDMFHFIILCAIINEYNGF